MPAAKTHADGLTDTWGRKNRRLADKACKECGNTFRPLRESSSYCSVPCARKKNGGHNRKEQSWWVNPRGYIEGRVMIGGALQAVKQHRYIMAQHIGRTLLPSEDVHHINGVKTDNRIENLELLAHGEHATEHNKSRVYVRGYRLNLSEEERASRSERMRNMRRAAKTKATGEQS